jgi:uncharacterized protein (TIGR00288 family)
MQNDEKRIAVFIDFENVAMGVRESKHGNFDIDLVLKRLVEKGKIMVKRAYSDWHRYSEFKRAFHQAAIELIDVPQTRYSGKNSADIRMVVDALDLSYQKEHIDTFVLVSGDSDFSPLVSKLRENGRYVIGMGVKQSSSDLLVNNCDEFIYYEDLVRPPAGHASDSRLLNLPAKKAEAMRLVIETFEALQREGKESIYGSMIKQTLIRKLPSFSESYYGYPSFSRLLEDAAENKLLRLTKDQKSGGYIVTGFSDAGGQPAGGPVNGEESPEAAAGTEALPAQAAPATTAVIAGIRNPRRSRWGRNRPVPGTLRPSPSSQPLREVPAQQEATVSESSAPAGGGAETKGVDLPSAASAEVEASAATAAVDSSPPGDPVLPTAEDPVTGTAAAGHTKAQAVTFEPRFQRGSRRAPAAHYSQGSRSSSARQQAPSLLEEAPTNIVGTDVAAVQPPSISAPPEPEVPVTTSPAGQETAKAIASTPGPSGETLPGAQHEVARRQSSRRPGKPKARSNKTTSGKPRKR